VGIGDLYSPSLVSRGSALRSLVSASLARLRPGRPAGASVGDTTRPTSALARRRAVMAASAAMMKRYRAKRYDGPVVVFAADERAPKFGPALGWADHVTGPISEVRIHGAHATMHRNNARDIAAALDQFLGR
jgi:thioesterase domain-containing protein